MRKSRVSRTQTAFFAAVAWAMVSLAVPAHADSLVANGDFEESALPNGAISLTMPGWSQYGDGAAQVLNVPSGPGQLPKPVQGYNVGVISLVDMTDDARHAIRQTPVAAMEAATEYRLVFFLGNPQGKIYLGRWQCPAAMSVTVSFVAGSDPATARTVGDSLTLPLIDIAEGAFAEFTLTLDTTDHDDLIGQPLSVVFELANNGMPVSLAGCFLDQVTMTAIRE